MFYNVFSTSVLLFRCSTARSTIDVPPTAIFAVIPVFNNKLKNVFAFLASALFHERRESLETKTKTADS